MPIYLFQHPKTQEIIEVVQRMCEPHTYSDAKGVVWDRVFTKPQAAVNTQISATDSKSFVDKTRGKNYSLGQLWDMSAELSAKRGGVTGQDPVKAKAEQSYKKKTGKPHPLSKRGTAVI